MSDAKPSPKEAVYDRDINPLMAQVIAFCKQHNIGMLATFSLGVEVDEDHPSVGEALIVTTAMPCPDDDPKDTRSRFGAATQMILEGFAALAVTTRKRG